MAKKKTSKRSREKYPNLKPELNTKKRYELIDYDYVGKLNNEEKAWLDKFTAEWAGASFSKDDDENIHKSREHKKEIYNRNNARNRCILTEAKATGMIKYLDDLKYDQRAVDNEDEMNLRIDVKSILEDLEDGSDNSED